MPKKLPLAEVLHYDSDQLAIALSNDYLSPDEIKTEKIRHYHFLADYFNPKKQGHLASTILIENKYLSKSYLLDYSNFYSTCYVNYNRFCKRVHFFGEKFSLSDLNRTINHPIFS